AQAELLLAQSLVLFQGQGNVTGVVRARLSMGHVARARGRFALATARYRDSMSYNWEHHPLMEHIIPAIEGLAGVFMTQGHAEHAARLLGAADSLRADFDVPLSPINRADYERDVAAARAQMDEAAFAAAWAAGQALPLEQAIAEALGVGVEAPP